MLSVRFASRGQRSPLVAVTGCPRNTVTARGAGVPASTRALGAESHVIGGDADLSFPGRAVEARAKQLFAGPVTTEVLEGCRHSPPTTDAFRVKMSKRLADFLS